MRERPEISFCAYRAEIDGLLLQESSGGSRRSVLAQAHALYEEMLEFLSELEGGDDA